MPKVSSWTAVPVYIFNINGVIAGASKVSIKRIANDTAKLPLNIVAQTEPTTAVGTALTKLYPEPTIILLLNKVFEIN